MKGYPGGDRHPITGLPTGRVVEERIRAVRSEEDGCVIYVGLNNFEAFEGGSGLFGPNAVLRFVAILLVDSVDELGQPQDVVAHLGRDEFAIVTVRESADRLRERIQRRFADEVRGFYDPLDWSRGFTEIRTPEGGTWRVPLLKLNFTLFP